MSQPGRKPPYNLLRPAMEDVEVSELALDDEEFSTAFGSLTTQFDNINLSPEEPDPWNSRRRID